jgi:hypothetical protein
LKQLLGCLPLTLREGWNHTLPFGGRGGGGRGKRRKKKTENKKEQGRKKKDDCETEKFK